MKKQHRTNSEQITTPFSETLSFTNPLGKYQKYQIKKTGVMLGRFQKLCIAFQIT